MRRLTGGSIVLSFLTSVFLIVISIGTAQGIDITDSSLASGEVAKAFADKYEDYVIKIRRELHMHVWGSPMR